MIGIRDAMTRARDTKSGKRITQSGSSSSLNGSEIHGSPDTVIILSTLEKEERIRTNEPL